MGRHGSITMSSNGRDHHRHMLQDFRRRFLVSLAATLPVLALSPTIQDWLGFTLEFQGSVYVLFAVSSFLFFYGGWPFLHGLYRELTERRPGMMTLIAVAISVAYFYSTAVVFGLPGKYFFWELATLIDVMLLGHWVEMRSVMSASRALEKLAQLMPDVAHRVTDGDTEDVSVDELQTGDRLLVKPGEKIPADGVVVEGDSYVNEAMLTGESTPVHKQKDSEVIGGAINGDGSLEVEVQHTGDDTYLSKVITLVEEAQASQSQTQRLADRAAFWLTVIALTAGFATLTAWLFAGKSFVFSIERMATVMVITCPHALGLAIPLVVAVSTTLSARNGLLIRNRTAFENARKITTVVFDKTGTLTEGSFAVTMVQPLSDEYDEEALLRLAASLERRSEHPIAGAVIDMAEQRDVEPAEATDFQAVKGQGIQGEVDGHVVAIVSPSYLEEQGIERRESMERDAATVVYVLVDGTPAGVIALSDTLRPQSKEAVQRLKKAGIECWMLTGDTESVAASVAEELNLDGYFAGVLPHEKQEKVKALQERDAVVAMTGDGINDAPALAQADVGIAIGSGTDVAAETADIILVDSDPMDVASLILFGEATYGKMVQNLLWATGYNVVAIPLAAGVLYNQGIVISPAAGAILMSLSTIIVAVNARLLRMPEEDNDGYP
ncbi:MAG: cadmium-translocating P-type ATPase [Candidatus Thermoplasmatota archaeon]|nr:cadmium-translocating P-type ATPase [Candidatus Thermoplasmatota archaeon]